MIKENHTRLQQMLQQSPYEAYTYAYPHKTAYRPLPKRISLRDAWKSQSRSSLFLYLHLPFCEMRCGFCNLFTTSNPGTDLVQSYLASLKRQAAQVRNSLDKPGFVRLAFGGGTPTFLTASELETLFLVVEDIMGVDPTPLPFSVETSSATATLDRLAMLHGHHVDRISVGIQSFIEKETAAVGRSQKQTEIETALQNIRSLKFPILNIDLIYGLPGQTIESWLQSLSSALEYQPEELFLYPLYVRPLTGLGRKDRTHQDLRSEMYCEARSLLLSKGYTQASMRMFRFRHAPAVDGPAYCAQEDGMIGLGCGARSYTRELHYAMPFAVGAPGVRNIIKDYCAQTDDEFCHTDYGFILDTNEQKRRYVAQTLLLTAGLSLSSYQSRFNSMVFDDLPELLELEPAGLAIRDADLLHLTPEGVAKSDVIGPWLYSLRVTELMRTFELR